MLCGMGISMIRKIIIYVPILNCDESEIKIRPWAIPPMNGTGGTVMIKQLPLDNKVGIGYKYEPDVNDRRVTGFIEDGKYWPLVRTYTTKYVKVLSACGGSEKYEVTGQERITFFVINPQKVIEELLAKGQILPGDWKQISAHMWQR